MCKKREWIFEKTQKVSKQQGGSSIWLKQKQEVGNKLTKLIEKRNTKMKGIDWKMGNVL